VTDSMVTIKQVPASLRLTSAFTDSKVAIGQAVRSPISAGEQVLTAKLAANPRDMGFSGQVPTGMRAISINATEVVNSGNLVQPGDSVDVIAVFERIDKGADDGSFLVKESAGKPIRLTTVVLAQDVKVLAVAQAFDETPSGNATPAKSLSGQSETRTVTLAVTPDDAQKLFLGDETGILRLSLHRFDDRGVRVPEDRRAPRLDVVDVSGPVGGDEERPVTSGDEEGVAPDARERPHR